MRKEKIKKNGDWEERILRKNNIKREKNWEKKTLKGKKFINYFQNLLNILYQVYSIKYILLSLFYQVYSTKLWLTQLSNNY